MSDFQPTHIIRVTYHDGKFEEIPVLESEGALYTKLEYEQCLIADWAFSDDRILVYQGQVPDCREYEIIKFDCLGRVSETS